MMMLRKTFAMSVLAVAAFAIIAPMTVNAGPGDYQPNPAFVPIPVGFPVPADNMICGPVDNCWCDGWADWMGSKNEKTALTVLKWIVFAVCVVSLAFFGYEFFTATCGWEETYVCIIELVHVCFSIWHMTDSPAMLYLSSGNRALWLRYAEWLLSCPVILIHLSNLTGMKNDYNKRTMALLVSDVGCIVWGTTAALALDAVKIIFFFLGLVYGMYTFYAAAKIYIEAYHTVPKGVCRLLVKVQAYDYFVTWSMFPILFMLGPEGFGKITLYTSGIAHEILDLFSKNLWGILGHLIRVKIHHHILVHGNITKKTKMTVGGEEVEIETYVDEEEANDPENAEEIVDNGTKNLANRQSFVLMRDRLQKKGVDVRASLGDDGMVPGGMKGNMMPPLQPGRVILCVPDQSLVSFFQEQYSLMPAPIEVVPALGPDVGLQLTQQAISIGGPNYVDYVLVHPEFLRDRTPNGLVAKLKSQGMRVCAFGWVPMGPHRELIEACGPMLDGRIEGPSFQSGFDSQQLVAMTSSMQQKKNQMAGMGMGIGGMGGMGFGMNPAMMNSMGGGMNPGMMNSMGGGMNPAMMNSMGGGMNPAMMNSMGGGMNPAMMNSMGGGMNPGMQNSMIGQNTMTGSMIGGAPQPSPMSLVPQVAPVTSASSPAAAAAGQPNETEMLRQLMGEINRLKSELGEQ